MTVLYVLDVPENTGIATVAAEDPAVSVGRIGPYFEITARISFFMASMRSGGRLMRS